MNPVTQPCASCGAKSYEFGFCSHCGAPLCSTCIKKNEIVLAVGAGHSSTSLPIPIGGGMIGHAIKDGLGHHKIDTVNFPFPHCPACVKRHSLLTRLVAAVSLGVGGFFFGLILWGMMAGSGYNWNNIGLYSILAAVLGGIVGFIVYVGIRGFRFRQDIIRCPKCGKNIQDSFVAQGLAGRTVVPYGSQGIGMESKTYLGGINIEADTRELADHVQCPACGYDGPLKERIGLHKFVRRNGLDALRETMWESLVKGY